VHELVESLVQVLHDFCRQQPRHSKYWLAYSGGLDSHVLVAVFHQLLQMLPLQVTVLHINHGLSPNAEQWAAHCKKVANDYGMAYREHALFLKPQKGLSLEALAREQRYAFFASCLQPQDILLTAHQEDDQAETVFLQLLRGAGPKGLSAMPLLKPYACGFHGRPFLHCSRSDLEKYALLHQLEWIEDESNLCLSYTRNFIRHAVFPILQQRWPSMAQMLRRSAAHCGEMQQVIDECVSTWIEKARGLQAQTLSVKALLKFSAAQQKLILRHWISAQGIVLPDSKKLNSIVQTVLLAAPDRFPELAFQNMVVRRYRDELYLLQKAAPYERSQSRLWDLSTPLEITGIGCLEAVLIKGEDDLLKAEIKTVSVRFRQGGEVLGLGKRGHHSLKHFFQDKGVPPWERNRLPLIYLEEKLIAVLGYFLDESVRAEQGEEGWRLNLTVIPAQGNHLSFKPEVK
jgi:tRNA(Ile)-lysidine synthase